MQLRVPITKILQSTHVKSALRETTLYRFPLQLHEKNAVLISITAIRREAYV